MWGIGLRKEKKRKGKKRKKTESEEFIALEITQHEGKVGLVQHVQIKH